MWKRLVEIRVGAWVERIPTEINIADDPSRSERRSLIEVAASDLFLCDREDYSLLAAMKAVRVEAMLDDIFMLPQSWESLAYLG